MVLLTICHQIKNVRKNLIGIFILVMMLTTFTPSVFAENYVLKTTPISEINSSITTAHQMAQPTNQPAQPPTINISSPGNGATYPKGTVINVSATASGNVRVNAMGLYLDGSQLTRPNGNSLNYQINTSNLSPGTHTIKVTAVNDSGKSSERSVTITINAPPQQTNSQQQAQNPANNTAQQTVQAQPPTINISSPGNGAAYTKGTPINVSATASGNVRINAMALYLDGSQLTRPNGNSINYQINTSNLSPGTHTIKVTAVNDSGKSSERSISIVINAPQQTNSQQPTQNSANNTAQQNAQAQPPTINISSPGNGATYTKGAMINVAATASGNVRVNAMGVYLDGSQLTRPNGNSVNYQINTSNLSPGQHTIKVTAVNDGGKSSERSINIVINAPATIQQSTGSIAPQTAQAQPPTINISSPSSGTSYTQGTPINVSATATGNVRVNAMGLYLDGSQLTRPNGNSLNYQINTSNLSPGTHSIKITAVNDSGKSSEHSISIVINNSQQSTNNTVLQNSQAQPPTINISSPGSGTSYTKGTPINVAATASGSIRVDAMGLYLDGSQLTRPNGNSLNYQINTSNLSAGQHTIKVTAVNDSGKSSERIITITINNDLPSNLQQTALQSTTIINQQAGQSLSNQLPIVNITDPTNEKTYDKGLNINISASATSNATVTGMGVYVDGGERIHRVNTNNLTYPLSTANLAPGSHTIRITAIDTNNKIGERTVNIIISDTPKYSPVNQTNQTPQPDSLQNQNVPVNNQYEPDNQSQTNSTPQPDYPQNQNIAADNQYEPNNQYATNSTPQPDYSQNQTIPADNQYEPNNQYATNSTPQPDYPQNQNAPANNQYEPNNQYPTNSTPQPDYPQNQNSPANNQYEPNNQSPTNPIPQPDYPQNQNAPVNNQYEPNNQSSTNPLPQPDYLQNQNTPNNNQNNPNNQYLVNQNPPPYYPQNQNPQLNNKVATEWFEQGNDYIRTQNYDNALAAYTNALTANPQFTEAYINRGMVYTQKSLYDKAIADYTNALAVNPQSDGAYYNRGNAYFNKGLYDNAIDDYSKAIEINPQDAFAYFNKAKACENMARFYEAAEAYRKFIQYAPPGDKDISEAQRRLSLIGR